MTAQYPPTEQTFGRLFFMVLLSLFFSATVVMAPVAAYPLATAQLIFKRARAWSAILLGLLVMAVLGPRIMGIPYSVLIITSTLFSLFIGAGVAEFFRKKWTPMQIVVGVSALIFVLLAVVMGGYFVSTGQGLEAYVADQAKELVQFVTTHKAEILGQSEMTIEQSKSFDMLTNEQVLTKEVMNYLPQVPSLILMSLLFTSWVTVFLVLRSHKIYKFKVDYPFTDGELLNFSVPDFFIWPLMVSLAVLVIGPEYLGTWSQSGAENFLRVLGTFYFFQGFGVYITFLDYMGLFGLLRTLLVMIIIFSGSMFVAALGLVDVWLNLRKRMREKMQK